MLSEILAHRVLASTTSGVPFVDVLTSRFCIIPESAGAYPSKSARITLVCAIIVQHSLSPRFEVRPVQISCLGKFAYIRRRVS